MSDLPNIMTPEEVEALVPGSEVTHYSTKRAPARSELVEKARQVIEQSFPKISTRLNVLWGTKECELLLDDLVVSNRADRAGFPAEVLSSLLLLSDEHFRLFGTFKKKAGVWDPLIRNP